MVLYKFSDDMEINNAPLYNSLLGKLQKDILTGKLKPGEKLTEQNLCRLYVLLSGRHCGSWRQTVLWRTS